MILNSRIPKSLIKSKLDYEKHGSQFIEPKKEI
jgi:hypothetical protein